MEENTSHRLECGTCQKFVDQQCETCHDCRWVYECAKLGGIWTPRIQTKAAQLCDQVKNEVLEKYRNSIPRKAFVDAINKIIIELTKEEAGHGQEE